MRINEIDYTPGVNDAIVTSDSAEIISSAELVGAVDNKEVYLYRTPSELLYFTQTNKSIDAFIVLSYNYQLHGVRNYSGERGMISMLVGFVTHQLKKKIYIDSTEKLTPEGISWLCKLIDSTGRGWKIVDTNGDKIVTSKLRQEWEHCTTHDIVGETGVIIECVTQKRLPISIAETRMQSPVWFVGCTDLD
jgi:hypothetical protein